MISFPTAPHRISTTAGEILRPRFPTWSLILSLVFMTGLLLLTTRPTWGQVDTTDQDSSGPPAETVASEPTGKQNIVLIHGLGSSASVWDEVTAILQQMFTVWLFELPGHGTTPPVSQPTVDSVAALLGQYITANEVEYPILVGHSMGGLIAMRYSFDNPAQVKRLIVIDAAPKQLASQEQKIYVADQLMHDYDRFIASQFLNMSLRQEVSDRLVDQALRTDSASLASLLMSSFDFDLTEELPRQAVPILVIGSNFLFPDPKNARQHLDELGYAKARTISFKHIPGVGHFVMLERPAYLVSVIVAFAFTRHPR